MKKGISFALFMAILTLGLAAIAKEKSADQAAPKMSAVTIKDKKTIKAAGVRSVVVKTTIVNLQFVPSDDQDLHLELILDFKGLPESEKANLKIKSEIQGSELTVQTPEVKSRNFGSFDLERNLFSGRLIVRLPKDLKDIAVSTISGNMNLQKVNPQTLKVRTVSGDVVIPKSQIESFSMQTVAGNLQLGGAVKKVNIEGVSGDVYLKLENSSPDIVISSTSGDTKIAFKSRPSAKVFLDSMSGDFHVDDRLSSGPHIPEIKEVMLGQGQGQIKAKTVSGNLTITEWN